MAIFGFIIGYILAKILRQKTDDSIAIAVESIPQNLCMHEMNHDDDFHAILIDLISCPFQVWTLYYFRLHYAFAVAADIVMIHRMMMKMYQSMHAQRMDCKMVRMTLNYKNNSVLISQRLFQLHFTNMYILSCHWSCLQFIFYTINRWEHNFIELLRE